MRIRELVNESPLLKNTGSYNPNEASAVKKVQTALQRKGYDVGPTGVDGKYGPRTEAAVRKFQTDNNLQVDGIVGPDTRNALGVASVKTLDPDSQVGFFGDTSVGLDLVSKSNDVSGDAIDIAATLIKEFEGYYSKAYWDYKQYSIGYGSKAKSKNEVIDKPEAMRRLKQEMKQAQQNVLGIMKKGNYNWSSKQVAALISFAYNIGSINQLTANGTRDDATILAKIPQYRKAGGKVLRGLVKRRTKEAEVFKQGMTNAIKDIVSEDNREEAKKIIQQINDLNDIPGLSGIEFDDDGEVADATHKAKNIEPTEPKQLTPLQQQRQVGQSRSNIGQWALHTTDHEAFTSIAKADFLMASAHYESNDFDPRFKKYENFISLGRGKNNIFQRSMYEGGVTMVLDVNKMRQIRGAKYSKAFVYGSYDEKTKKLQPVKKSFQKPSGSSFVDEAEHRMYFKTQFIDDWHKYIKEIHFNMPVREGKPASHLIKAEEMAREYAEKFNIKYFVYKDRAAYNMLAKGYAMSSRAIKKAGGLARLFAFLVSKGKIK